MRRWCSRCALLGKRCCENEICAFVSVVRRHMWATGLLWSRFLTSSFVCSQITALFSVAAEADAEACELDESCVYQVSLLMMTNEARWLSGADVCSHSETRIAAGNIGQYIVRIWASMGHILNLFYCILTEWSGNDHLYNLHRFKQAVD